MEPRHIRPGLEVVYCGTDPKVDIVAVHGLGSSPLTTWVRRVKDEDTGEEKEVHWLAQHDMLPAKIPHARIMTFNYESEWFVNAPKQRIHLCGERLVGALDNQRREDKAEYRPLIFIGHSFGGVVIEQALVIANTRGSSFQHISTSTAGVIFLGTPHRGAAAARWAGLIASSLSQLGRSTEDRILKQLREDSDLLTDLLYEFSLWLFRMSVPTVCFFEQHETDCGKKLWSGLSWKFLVVDEKSATIDGHRKIGLPTDHIKLNKYGGPDDPSFMCVFPEIVKMAKDANKLVHQRLSPRELTRDDSGLVGGDLRCCRAMFLTNPLDDLNAIKVKNKRVPGTCEWILVQPEYTACLVNDGPQLLRLVGGPGIGKTMISTFLAGELDQMAQNTPAITFAYYFCDDKDEKRNTATAIIRGLLLQLLWQHHGLFDHIRQDFAKMGDQLFSNMDALWRIFCKILTDPRTGRSFLLIDALDECEKSTRAPLLRYLADLFDSSEDLVQNANIKLLITCRPERDIEYELSDIGGHIRIDSTRVNADLLQFIQIKVGELAKKKKYPLNLQEKIHERLKNQAGGTFLWVSFVLEELRLCDNYEIESKLKDLPNNLNDVYDRILMRIAPSRAKVAVFVLRCFVAALRPLSIGELATAYVLEFELWTAPTVPTDHFLDEFRDISRSCGPLISICSNGERESTVNFVHQSVKDYLVGEYLKNNTRLSHYHVKLEEAHFLMLQICWTYLSKEEFNSGENIVSRDGKWKGHDRAFLEFRDQVEDDSLCFSRYSRWAWIKHALAASPKFDKHHTLGNISPAKLPTLRDYWLKVAARIGQLATVQLLLAHGAGLNSETLYGETSLLAAALGGHEMVVKVLIAKGANPNHANWYGQTPLILAARGGHVRIVQHLLAQGADLNAVDEQSRTALRNAASGGHEKVVQLLIAKGANPNQADWCGETPLMDAARCGYLRIIQHLLVHGADLNVVNDHGRTALRNAASGGHEKVVHLLLANGARRDPADNGGICPLWEAAKSGHEAVVPLLLADGSDLNFKDANGRTALWWAAARGHESAIQLLFNYGADQSIKDNYGRTPLWQAATHGHEAVVQMLLGHGAESMTPDKYGLTPLWGAAFGGHEDLLQALIAFEADSDIVDNAAQAPSWQATATRQGAVVKLLLDHLVNVERTGMDGRIALCAAANCRHGSMSQFLLTEGANMEQYLSCPLFVRFRDKHSVVELDAIKLSR